MGLREATRCLLERAVTDWSVKLLVSRVSSPSVDRSEQESPRKISVEDPSSDEAFSGGTGCAKRAIAVGPSATKELNRDAKMRGGAMIGHDMGGDIRRRRPQGRSRWAGTPEGTADVRTSIRAHARGRNRKQHYFARPTS